MFQLDIIAVEVFFEVYVVSSNLSEILFLLIWGLKWVSMQINVFSVNKDGFASSFSIFVPFIFLSCYIGKYLLHFSVFYLIEKSHTRYLCLVPELNGNTYKVFLKHVTVIGFWETVFIKLCSFLLFFILKKMYTLNYQGFFLKLMSFSPLDYQC